MRAARCTLSWCRQSLGPRLSLLAAVYGGGAVQDGRGLARHGSGSAADCSPDVGLLQPGQVVGEPAGVRLIAGAGGVRSDRGGLDLGLPAVGSGAEAVAGRFDDGPHAGHTLGDVIQFAGRSVDIDADRVAAWGEVTREELAALAAMPNLRALNLNTANISDDDLELVGRLTALQDLDVSTTDITDAGVRTTGI